MFIMRYSRRIWRRLLLSAPIILLISSTLVIAQEPLSKPEKTFGISFWTNSGNNFSNIPFDRVEFLSGIAGKYLISSHASCAVGLGGAFISSTPKDYSAMLAYIQYEYHFAQYSNSPISPYFAIGIGTNLSLITTKTDIAPFTTSVSSMRLLGLFGIEYKILSGLSAAIQYGLGTYYSFGNNNLITKSPSEVAFGLGNASLILTFYFE